LSKRTVLIFMNVAYVTTLLSYIEVEGMKRG